MTCNKEIGGNTGFRNYCIGKSIETLSQLEFSDLVVDLNLNDPDGIFWVVSYFIIALIPFIKNDRISDKQLRVVAAIFFIIGLLIIVGIGNPIMPTQFDNQMANMWEHQREGAGLILGAVWIWFSRKIL